VRAIHRHEPDGAVNPTAVIWREYAYFGGPAVFEIVAATTTDAPMPPWVHDPHDPHPEIFAARLRAQCRLSIAALHACTPGDLVKTIELAEALETEFNSTGHADRARDMFAVYRDMLKSARRNVRRRKPRHAAKTYPMTSAMGPVGSGAFSGGRL
jgi:hypothetical protein